MPEPLTLRHLAERVIDATKLRCDNDIDDEEYDEIVSSLWSALDAQEATLRRGRYLVESWKILACACAVSHMPAGHELDKAYTACARELEAILDGE